MDTLESRLKDLILFVNQNSQFDIYAVELEYYRFEDYEIMIPRLFGAEVKKDVQVASGSSSRRHWTREQFVEDAQQKNDGTTFTLVKELLEFSEKNCDEIGYGTSARNGSVTAKVRGKTALYSLYTLFSNGKLSLNFGYLLAKGLPDDVIVGYMEDMEVVFGASFDKGNLNNWPSVSVSALLDNGCKTGFFSKIQRLIKTVRSVH